MNSTLNRDRNPPLEDIKKAIEYDPSNAEYYYNLAHYYMRLPFETEELQIEHNEEIITNLEKAVLLNPVNGIYWYDLGVNYSYKGYEGNAYYSEWLPRADKAFQIATYLRPNDSSLLYKIGLYWVFRSSLLPDEEDAGLRAQGSRQETEDGKGHGSDPRDGWMIGMNDGVQLTREEGIKKFQGLFKRSISINKRYWKKAVERVWQYYPDKKIVMGIIPEEDIELTRKVKEWIDSKGN